MSKNVKKTLVILVLAVFIAVATLSVLIFSGVLKKPVRVDNVKTLAFAKTAEGTPLFGGSVVNGKMVYNTYVTIN